MLALSIGVKLEVTYVWYVLVSIEIVYGHSMRVLIFFFLLSRVNSLITVVKAFINFLLYIYYMIS